MLAQHEILSVFHRECGFGVGERQPVAIPIDDEQQVALVHELIVPHTNIIDVAGNVRRDRNHIGADPGVPGPWRIEIVARHVVAEQTSRDE